MKQWIAAVLAAMMILGNFGEVYAAPEETLAAVVSEEAITEAANALEEVDSLEEADDSEEVPDSEEADDSAEQRDNVQPEEPFSAALIERPTGLLPMEERTVEPEEISPESIYDSSNSYESRIYRSAVYANKWDKYSTNYYYNQLSEAGKKVWDDMDAICREYLTTSCNAELIRCKDGTQQNSTKYVKTCALSADDLIEVMYLFRLSNPQYYFLNTNSYGATDGFYTIFAFGIYKAFANGTNRASATAQVEDQIQKWERDSDLESCSTPEAKVIEIHNLICDKVTYNHEVVNQGLTKDVEEIWFTQSCYSVLAMNTTVCAGYAQAFQLMCNGQGIDAISVTSSDHQWNKVRLNDSWYNVDVTWDDDDFEHYPYPIIYYYLERSDTVFHQDPSHWEEMYLTAYLPPCTLDSNATYDAPGTLPVISGETATPDIIITSGGGFYSVYFSCSTPNATIYYTQNGETPSVAATKSTRYRMPLWITDLNAFKEKVRTKQVQAVAVSNARWDSAVSSPDTLYNVSYVMNGGTNHGDNPVAYSGLATAFALKNPTRSGYAFGGWYTDSSFTRRITSISAGSKGNLTLYAKWTLLPSPTMKFASPSLTKTYEQNATFTNKLTANTDGKITYKSGNTKVATVDKNSGKVTIKGVGTTNITATAAVTSKFQGKSLSYTLTVKKNSKPTMKFASATVTKYPSGKTQTFTNKLTENTDGKITYKSGNTAIATVNSSGKVTIKKNAMGKVKITATAPATANCSKRTVSYTLQVIPKATTLSKVTNPSGKKLKATWKKIGSITGYQVQYSTDKNFKKGVTTKTVSDGKTTSETYGKLKKNKTYYVRVRTYKQKDKTKHYSQWSNVKSIKIKK